MHNEQVNKIYKIFKKRETKENEDSAKLIRCNERIAGIRPKYGGLFANIAIFPPPVAQQPAVRQGLLTIEASRSHSDTPHSVRLLWTSDQHDAETST